MTAAWDAAISDSDPLVALAATKALVDLLHAWEAKLASEAVAGGATWEAIGTSVGVSRQAAWERFHRDVADFRRHVATAARVLKQRHKQEWHELRDDLKRRAREEHRRRR